MVKFSTDDEKIEMTFVIELFNYVPNTYNLYDVYTLATTYVLTPLKIRITSHIYFVYYIIFK